MDGNGGEEEEGHRPRRALRMATPAQREGEDGRDGRGRQSVQYERAVSA